MLKFASARHVEFEEARRHQKSIAPDVPPPKKSQSPPEWGEPEVAAALHSKRKIRAVVSSPDARVGFDALAMWFFIEAKGGVHDV